MTLGEQACCTTLNFEAICGVDCVEVGNIGTYYKIMAKRIC